jgi:hypothetical protein
MEGRSDVVPRPVCRSHGLTGGGRPGVDDGG